MMQVCSQETIHNHHETLDLERTVYLGRLAIRSEYLGINDPLTHLHQYIERGESALVGIKEDIETDIAERLPKTPFVNYVGFEHTGDDFVSLKDKVSMKKMTSTNLRIFTDEAIKNPDMAPEYERAKLESLEVTRINEWFTSASIGSCIVFESLPIGSQKFAISRIYRKSDERNIEGCFVSLYNPSVDRFNEFRKSLCVESHSCKDEFEILANPYEFYAPELNSKEDFTNFYVGLYDNIMNESDGKNYCFGIETDRDKQKINGLEKVRSQPKLTAIYLDTIKALTEGGGLVTPKIIGINESLGLGYRINEGSRINIDLAKNILSDVIAGITSVIDRANASLLEDLENFDTSKDASYQAVSLFGEQARTEGEKYESNGCPEYSRQTQSIADDNSVNERQVIEKAFDIKGEEIRNFGTPKIGLCRIMNCPSRGEINWLPQKTLVGGCDICVCCHKIFAQGRLPKSVYNDMGRQKTKKPR